MKKKIMLLTTGGTIASKDAGQGLTPLISCEEILSCVPEASELATLYPVSLFNLDSTNVCSKHWLQIARTIQEQYDRYDGFVITHGTDTMAYTAAALSYLIQNSSKPVVLTGSQKSIYLRDTDARKNLIGAIRYAADDRAQGVHLVFDGKVILGTRAKKTRTKSFNAFSSIDFPEVARIRDDHIFYYIEEKNVSPVCFYQQLDSDIFVYKLIPGADPKILDFAGDHYHGIIIESFGVGGIPCYENTDFQAALQRVLEKQVAVVMTTQVPHEGSDMDVYEVGHRAKEELGLIEAYDMTLEALTAKLMWILGQTREPDQIRKLFYTPVAHDISE